MGISDLIKPIAMKLSLFCTILNLSTHIKPHKSERETKQEWNKICQYSEHIETDQNFD